MDEYKTAKSPNDIGLFVNYSERVSIKKLNPYTILFDLFKLICNFEYNR